MSLTATSRRGSVTCIFEDLERKSHAQANVNTDKPEMTTTTPSSPAKTGKNLSNHHTTNSTTTQV